MTSVTKTTPTSSHSNFLIDNYLYYQNDNNRIVIPHQVLVDPAVVENELTWIMDNGVISTFLVHHKFWCPCLCIAWCGHIKT